MKVLFFCIPPQPVIIVISLFHLETGCLHFFMVIYIHSVYKHVGIAVQGRGAIPFLPVMQQYNV